MKYFAYGSNMDRKRMEERSITFSQRVHAILEGYSLAFNKVASHNPKEGYANIIPDEKGFVEGALYEFPDSELKKLDKFERCPDHYGRITVKVLMDDGKESKAITYVAQPNKVREGLKPCKNYLDHLLAGRDILSESYYRRLLSWETLD